MSSMTAGIAVAVKGKKCVPGALVQVNIETEKAQMKNVASKFNGHVYRIETRHQPKPTKPPQFTLVGCESEFGLPYWFIEEDLILL